MRVTQASWWAALTALLLGASGCPTFRPSQDTLYPCEANKSQCVSGWGCQGIPDPAGVSTEVRYFCMKQCGGPSEGNSGCPTGWDCVHGEDFERTDGTGETGFCIPSLLVPATCDPYGLDCPCETNEDCHGPAGEDFWCVTGVGGANVCTFECDQTGDCADPVAGEPPDYDCMNTGLGFPPEAVCMPPVGRLCQPCGSDTDCDFASEDPAGGPAHPDNRCVMWTDPRGKQVGSCGQGRSGPEDKCPEQTVEVEVETTEGVKVSQCFPTAEGPEGCGPISFTSTSLGFGSGPPQR